MLLPALSFKKINQIILLFTLISLAYKRGHFSGTLIPSPFQILFVVSIILTIIYVIKNHQIKVFFLSVPRKILLAIGCLFFSVLLGWVMGIFFTGISTTLYTIRDFGTFTMSIIIIFLILFYTKDDEKYAKLYLYALFIPNFYILYYFFTHGIIGYCGVLNDNFLSGLVDPNMHSKVLLIPALFFISMSLFALKKRKWLELSGYTILASISSMLIFWTVSRGSILSLTLGAILIWLIFSVRDFSWKKLIGGWVIIFIVVLLGYMAIPYGTKQELQTKIINTGNLPVSTNSQVSNIIKAPAITINEIRETPRSEVRLLEWSFFIKYAFSHPFGVGPSSSSVDYQSGSYLQLRPGNTYLQVWLWGGVLGITSFFYILWNAFVILWTKWKRFFDVRTLALLGILFALSVSIVFDASLYFYWFFIILAFSLQNNNITDIQTITQPKISKENE